jgi:cation transport protein ChaC
VSAAERGLRKSGRALSPEIAREIGDPRALAAGVDGSLWVFAYGSLMWRPGFAYARRCKALLRGWRRSLCVFSHVYRGSPERPGLVLGLDRGGACPGVAFEVDPALSEATVRYLREREQATAVYLERIAPVTLESGDRVLALTYVADRLHRQYAGRLDREAMLEIVRAGQGQSGDNAAYILETNDHLQALGMRDRDLEWLSARLRG